MCDNFSYHFGFFERSSTPLLFVSAESSSVRFTMDADNLSFGDGGQNFFSESDLISAGVCGVESDSNSLFC